MRDPLFSYNLSRAYPVRWFTPVVLVGGIIATVLVSVLSVATSGYQLNSVPSSNPNNTESGRAWFGSSLNSITGGMQPACASTTIPLNTVLYTNNTGLAYTLQGITLRQQDGTTASQGSLLYHNNMLQNCTISSIVIDFESLQRSALALAIQQQGADLTAYIQCLVETPQGIITVDLTTTWADINSGPGPSEATFVNRDPKMQASLYWAYSLLKMYWIQLTNNMFENNNEAYGFYKGYVKLTHSTRPASTAADVESLDFFDAECWFMPFNGTGMVTDIAFCENAPRAISTLANGTVSDYSKTSPMPMIWIPADSLAKSFYYAILSDLGQTVSPNLLTDTGLLKYFTNNFTGISATFGTISWENAVIGAQDGVATSPYSDDSAGALRVGNSTLATNYICQVPQLKPTGSLIVAVLVADLVLLQAIWKIFKLIVDPVLLKRNPEMRYCEGCLESIHSNEKRELADDEGLPATEAIPATRPARPYAAVDQDSIEMENLLDGGSSPAPKATAASRL
ncbi:Uu.00g048060.m01.CDS01 [Anthostomella pinea]|uniref:Uu.00g048060.m01.CDS01 n=1 Tax=Anthostomella pinea TaxID=933095 RepID=A0AAI8V6M3_9PEZI|nr:Uu.00g048060.m01.CDS01 [Anthostomella pinea]